MHDPGIEESSMSTLHTRRTAEWKVRPHGPLTSVDDKVLTVTGELHMPMEFERRMTVVRLSGARLAIFSAISLDEAEMIALEVHGQPAFLIVPNGAHRLDAGAWKERYPSIVVVAPEGAREDVEKKVHVDTSEPDFGDPDVDFITVDGTDAQEAALLVRSDDGPILVLNDLIANLRGQSGIGGWFLRRMGFAGDEPHIPAPIRMRIVEDKAKLRGQLLRWADMPALRCIIVSHGAPIEEHPAQVLRELAASLA
jgi:hypothetical protein